jgi:hypothetical protein
VTVRRIRISRPIRALMDAVARFICLEGALRSAKTWGALFKIRRKLDEHPGIRAVISRWKDDDVKTKLLPEWRIVCAFMGLSHGTWNATESCYDFPNGSRCYVISIKASENEARYSKVRGYTVSLWYIDQLEEVPRDVFHEIKLRLSQPGFPHQLIATPNPVHHGHWIAEEFPDDNSKANHLYISSSIWDNTINLDATTIEAAEAMYPVGHPMRGPKLEGKRGANMEGTPVYAGCFNPLTHLSNGLQPYPYVDILAGWDFGAKHPAVVFGQMLPWGASWILGGIMGSDVPLEQFAPFVLQTAEEWFPGRTLQHCGDPAGSHRNSQGVSVNAVKALQDIGVGLVVLPDSNTNTVRTACVQALQGFMLNSVKRFVTDNDPVRHAQLEGRSLPVVLAEHAEPAFLLNPRFLMHSPRGTGMVPVIAEALGAGYIWDDDHRRFSQADGNLRMPKKDGFFEHPMNALEYLVHNFWQSVRMPASTVQRNFRAVQQEHYRITHHEPSKAEKAALRRAQIDRDDDEPRVSRRSYAGRGFRGRR